MNLEEALQGKHILVVDDDTVNHLLIHENLIDYDISVSFVSNGLEAVQHVIHNPVDIVFMDVRMPIMNGFEASVKIKELKPQVKIIIQTAFYREYKQDEMIVGMVDSFISKPIKRKKLIAALEEVFYIKSGSNAGKNMLSRIFTNIM